MATKKRPARPQEPQHEAQETSKASADVERETGQAARQKADSVRLELMRRLYVARDPESTPLTFLHHPDCDDAGGKGAAQRCEAAGCRAFSGLDVGAMIDRGYWNSVPGD